MNRYILDTNILIKAPSLLTKWSSRYRILIPDLVLQETGKVIGKIKGAENLLHKVDEATSKGFLHIIKSDPEKHIYSDELGKRRISYVDFQIAQLAKDYGKNKDDVFLVTEDRVLQRYAEEIGVKVLSLFNFQNIIQQLKTVDLKDIGKSKNVKTFQSKHLAVSFLLGIFLTVAIYVGYKNFELIVSGFPIWGTISLLVIIPFIFYWFRSNVRIAYAMAEFSVGFYSAYSTLKPLLTNFDIKIFTDLTILVPILGGIYVMVRGLDNFSKGIRGTSLENKWRKIFKD
ncbi:MAG: type II toxin-antitoxin system VapC family toxin [bacterium]|nr:type II toxin-antitoxin system VapC family toxin [bacterium]